MSTNSIPALEGVGLWLGWERSKGRRCTAHKSSDGEQCRNPAISGTTVCGHGGRAPQVKRKARLRLEMASDRLARQLLNMTSDPNVADSVKLAAIKDALDRSGLAAKNAVSVEVGITKPWETVFEGISQIIAGPRNSENPTALAGLPEPDAAIESTDDDAEIVGEFDDPPDADELEDDLPRRSAEIPTGTGIGIRRDYRRGNRRRRVHRRAHEPLARYCPPDQDQTQPDERTAPAFGPLGMTGPASSGLLPLAAAVEAQAEMNRRANLRDMRRR
jgi:hypothetical protein